MAAPWNGWISWIIRLMLIVEFSPSLFASLNEEGIASKDQAKRIIYKRCPYKLKRLWQTEVSTFPFSSQPLVADMDGDGGLDIVAIPFGEAVTVIEGERGKHLHDTNWPQLNLDKSVHSSPLLYDIDGDGVLDIFIITSSGEGHFYTGKGNILQDYSFQLPVAFLKKDWYMTIENAGHQTVTKFVSDYESTDHIPVDAHVLSTPVLHQMGNLVIPVSYYYSDEDYHGVAKPWGDDDAKGKYYATALVDIDLSHLRLLKPRGGVLNTGDSYIHLRFLELHQTPTFLLFTPIVINLDGDFGDDEIVQGSSSGNLYVMSLEDGKHRPGFPVNLGLISGKVTAVNLVGGLALELIVLTKSGKAICVDSVTGKTQWSSTIGGSSYAGSQSVDLDMDGQLDIVIASDDGNVYGLNGRNGSMLPNYPYKSLKRITGNVLITKFNTMRGPADLVFLSDTGILHVVASDLSCATEFVLAESSLVDLATHDLVLMNHGMEIVVATSDGNLICIGSGSETPSEELVEKEYRMTRHLLSYPSDQLSHNNFGFRFKKRYVFIEDETRNLKEVTGSLFFFKFSLHNIPTKDIVTIQVYLGSAMVYEMKEATLLSSQPFELKIQTPDEPGQGRVTVVLYDNYGFVDSDSLFLKFNQLILLDLQWLVLAPFIAMGIILLINHGFPAKDLLPVTFPFKAK